MTKRKKQLEILASTRTFELSVLELAMLGIAIDRYIAYLDDSDEDLTKAYTKLRQRLEEKGK